MLDDGAGTAIYVDAVTGEVTGTTSGGYLFWGLHLMDYGQRDLETIRCSPRARSGTSHGRQRGRALDRARRAVAKPSRLSARSETTRIDTRVRHHSHRHAVYRAHCMPLDSALRAKPIKRDASSPDRGLQPHFSRRRVVASNPPPPPAPRLLRFPSRRCQRCAPQAATPGQAGGRRGR